MSLINKIYLRFSAPLLKEIERSRKNPYAYQAEWFGKLIKCGSDSLFGREHDFRAIKSVEDFQRLVPIRDYNAISPYIERLRRGEDYVLWNQKVKWFAKSSGTSSDKSKFIPVTPDSLNINHFGGFKRMLASYIDSNPKSRIYSGKALTLGGSVKPDMIEISAASDSYRGVYPEAGMRNLSGSQTGTSAAFLKKRSFAMSGDLSAVLLKNSPFFVEFIRTPNRKTALVEDFNTKVELICRESSRQNVTNFAGVPSWNLILLNRILEYTGKNNICEVWPNMELFMHGGIGFEPYREIYKKIIPSYGMHYLENYNASEGYFAFQDDPDINSMLLSVNIGVFYEFIPMDILDRVLSGEIKEIPSLEGVKTGVNYAVVISTAGGLWRYLIGDCIQFTSLCPHRIKITGRTQLFINAFGEELMIENAEKALVRACGICGCSVRDFTVAPHFMEMAEGKGASKGYHKWGIEFSVSPADIEKFEEVLDNALAGLNSDYEAKRKGNATMERLRVIPLREGTFYKWMEGRDKLGGQNKVPRLYPDSRFLDELMRQAGKVDIYEGEY